MKNQFLLMSVSFIFATDQKYGIGKNMRLPWKNAEDMSFFKETTEFHVVIMGFYTFASMNYKALPNRTNIVLTEYHREDIPRSADVTIMDNLADALELYSQDRVFIIGGSSLFNVFLGSGRLPDSIYYSVIEGDYDCDVTLEKDIFSRYIDVSTPCIGKRVDKFQNHQGITIYTENVEEQAYLDLCDKVLEEGYRKEDRTGTGTISMFSPGTLTFSLRMGQIPVLTTKRVALKTGVIPELLWFLSGNTDTTVLEAQKCNIWKGNTSREFLDSRGLYSYRVGELGPGYGFQWRHNGAEYKGLTHDYTGEGFDQIAYLIKELKRNPDSRRLVLNSWIPSELDKMALPPCHIMYQLYTHVEDGKRYLSAQMYQRSADAFLGVPFNISSYSLLTHIIAKIVGMEPDKITFCYGDFHVYSNHISQMRTQISRSPTSFPTILFNRDIDDIDEITAEDFTIADYKPQPKISAPMAV